MPFGGLKASSSGFREMGAGGIEFLTTCKTFGCRHVKGTSP